MRLAFSTNGWDDFDWSDFYVTAKDLQFSGIEIHDIKREVSQERGEDKGAAGIHLPFLGKRFKIQAGYFQKTCT